MNMASQSTNEHREKAKSLGVIGIAIITVSDTRTEDTDVNGKWLREQIAALGHEVTAYRLIKDEPGQVAAVLDEMAGTAARILLWNGGTGIAPRDTTYDVLSKKLEKTLPGFGEIFRILSFEVVGAAAMLSRATAGVYRGKLVFSTPGSPNAVQLAWNRLLAPELEHLAWEVIR
jgi:molybdenum cofactor biosynthesis protein B